MELVRRAVVSFAPEGVPDAGRIENCPGGRKIIVRSLFSLNYLVASSGSTFPAVACERWLAMNSPSETSLAAPRIRLHTSPWGWSLPGAKLFGYFHTAA